MYSSEYIQREFTRFIKLVSELSNWYKNLFEIEIIDIKYLTSDYLHDVSEIENIKTRSIRKQFVYEYLVQRGLKKQRKKFKDLSTGQKVAKVGRKGFYKR